MRYRWGFDLGTNSLGWCVLSLDEHGLPDGVVRMGSRIFRDSRDAKSHASLAVDRRMARQQRRRRDRFLKRRERFMQGLIQFGLMPDSEAERKALVALDPYQLRKRGLDEQLSPYELGRALFHLNQRRGFKSNRKVDKADEDESGKVKSAVSDVREAMAESEARTVGEWLANRHAMKEPVRARKIGSGSKWAYELYIERKMVADEFDKLWEKQTSFTPELLTEEARDYLRDAMLFQRPLRKPMVGRCTLEPDDERAPLALPSVQRFRMLQELNHLYVVGDGLRNQAMTLDERNTLLDVLDKKLKMTFGGMRRSLRRSDIRFNLESEKRKDLNGNSTACALRKPECFGSQWDTFDLAEQDAIVEMLLAAENETQLINWLQTHYELDDEHAAAISRCNLPDGYGSLGRKALARVVPELERAVIPYSDAVVRAGYQSHSDLHNAEWFERLPYYGQVLQRYVAFGTGKETDTAEQRYGKIGNPTVHVGLNQLRVVVNALLERYGHPDEIVIELARELKQSREQRREIEKQQAERQEENDRIRKDLVRWGLPVNADNLLRVKLWKELGETPLDRRCPYTGEQIGQNKLFSSEVEIEHILPFSKTLDDSFPNKTLSMRRANRDKDNQSPFEAFASHTGYDWAGIQERASALPKNKSWRFSDDAMERFLREHKDFLARALTDTQYLSRVAREYLTHICPCNEVWVIPGRLTAMLRGKWGLNSILSDDGKKNRHDHRHHAIDAAVVAVTDRALLQRLSNAAGKARESQLNRLVEDMPLPWPEFQAAVRFAAERIVVSHKPEHGPQGQLHNDSAYGFAGKDDDGTPLAVRRVGVDYFTTPKRAELIRDPKLRERILDVLKNNPGKPADIAKALANFSAQTGIRHVRIVERLNLIPIGRNGDKQKPYKGYKGDSNYCIEIYCDPDGKWRPLIVTTFEANAMLRDGFEQGWQQLRNKTQAQNGEPLVMRLCNDDLVTVKTDDGATSVYRTQKIGGNGQIFLAEHQEANCDQRNRDKNDSFMYLSKMSGSLMSAQARRVFVDALGFVKDPGFKE